jgi:hypothetical protein
MALDDILNAFIGGGIPAPGQTPTAGDPLAEILQGILGGGASPAGASPGMGVDPLGGLLEGILGGGMAPGGSQGGMGLLPGMGGGEASMNGLLAPLADALAQKLGLPPEIAMMVVSFLGAKLLSGAGGAAGGAAGAKKGRSARSQATPQALDLDSLLETMGSDKGAARELAEQTGLDPATAERTLQEAIGMIGGGRQTRKPQPSNRPSGGGLDSLLDTW